MMTVFTSRQLKISKGKILGIPMALRAFARVLSATSVIGESKITNEL